LGAAAGRVAASELPDSVQQWLQSQTGLPAQSKGLLTTAARQYFDDARDPAKDNVPFLESAQANLQGLSAGLWSAGEFTLGMHDYPGDDQPIDWSPSGIQREVENWGKGRIAAATPLASSAVGVPLALTASLSQDAQRAAGAHSLGEAWQEGTRTVRAKPADVAATFSPLAGKAARSMTGALAGGDRAVLVNSEPLTRPVGEGTPTRGLAGWSRATGLPAEPVEAALAPEVLPVARQMVRDGLITGAEAAATLEKMFPWKSQMQDAAVKLAKPAFEVGQRVAGNAAQGALVLGEPFGVGVGAAVGALAPEAVRAFMRYLGPEKTATVIRNIGGRGSRYQQGTPEETAFAREVVENTHARGEGIGNLGAAIGGELLREQPARSTTPTGQIPLPPVETAQREVVVTPEGVPEIRRDAFRVRQAAADAAELPQRRAEIEAAPELAKRLDMSDPAAVPAMDALTNMEADAKVRRGQIGNSQAAFDRQQKLTKRNLRRPIANETTSPSYNAAADEMAALAGDVHSDVPAHWWRRAPLEPLLDPQSPTMFRSARVRGALIAKITEKMPKDQAAKLAPLLDAEMVKMSGESIGPRPQSAAYKLPDGRIVDLNVELGRLPREFANPEQPGMLTRAYHSVFHKPMPPAPSVYQHMQAEAVGQNYRAYGLKYGEAKTAQLIEAEANRTGGGLDKAVGDTLAKGIAREHLAGNMRPQALYADPRIAADAITADPAGHGLTPDQAEALAKDLKTNYVPTPQVTSAFLARAAEEKHITSGAPPFMRAGLASALEEHLSVNYMNDFLSAQESAMTRAGRFAKQNLTALSIGAKVANDTANATLQYLSRGLRPDIYAKDVLATADRWKAISQGAPASPYELQRQRSILKTGKLETDMLSVEAKRQMHLGPGSGGLLKKGVQLMRQAYSASDLYPKLEETIHNYDRMFQELGQLQDGKKYTTLVGPNVVATFERKNGVLELNGKPLTPEAASDVVARAAIQPALEKLVDHGDVNRMVSAMRRGGLGGIIGVIAPFLTWRWAVTDIPGLKKGILGAAFDGGPSIWTDDPVLARKQWTDAVKLTTRRGALTGMAYGALADHTDDELRRTFGRAMTPVVRALEGDPLEETVYDLSRSDWMAPSIALFRLGSTAAWQLRFGLTNWEKQAFPELKMGDVGDPAKGDPKVLRAWTHINTGKSSVQDALELVGFGGGLAAPVLREYFKPSGEGDWKAAAWGMSRAIVGGTPSDAVNIALASVLPKASSRRIERMGQWGETGGEIHSDYKMEDMLGFVLRRTLGVGIRSTNSLSEANHFIDQAQVRLEKELVGNLDKWASIAAADYANLSRTEPVGSPKLADARGEMERLMVASQIAKAQVNLAVNHYRERLAHFLNVRKSAITDPSVDPAEVEKAKAAGEKAADDLLLDGSEPTTETAPAEGTP